MSELDAASQAILDFIQERRGYVEVYRMIRYVEKRTGERHPLTTWWFRRLAALALEGRITGTVHRSKSLVIRFRRIEESYAGIDGEQASQRPPESLGVQGVGLPNVDSDGKQGR